MKCGFEANNLSKVYEQRDITYMKQDFVELIELIGFGSFSKVFTGKFNSNHENCIIKCTQEELLASKEYYLMKCVESHKNIIQVFSFVQFDSQNFGIVMENGGVELLHILNIQGFFDEMKIYKLLVEMTNGISFMHQHKIIHRDIKLENCVVNVEKDNFTSVKWIDFGLACFCNEIQSNKVGSLHYMAPEVWNHETYDERIDIWSLGICTFCMISCRHPFEVPDICCETFRQFKNDNLKIFDIFQNCSSNPFSYSSKFFQLLEFMLTFEKDLRIWSGQIQAFLQ